MVMIRMLAFRRVHTTASNRPFSSPMLTQRSSAPRGDGTVRRGPAIEQCRRINEVNPAFPQDRETFGFPPFEFHFL
jgi:hypothetical protein